MYTNQYIMRCESFATRKHTKEHIPVGSSFVGAAVGLGLDGAEAAEAEEEEAEAEAEGRLKKPPFIPLNIPPPPLLFEAEEEEEEEEEEAAVD